MKIYIQKDNYAKGGVPVIIAKQKKINDLQYEITETRFSIGGTQISIRNQTTISKKDMDYFYQLNHYFLMSYGEKSDEEYEKIQTESIGITLVIALVKGMEKILEIAMDAILTYSNVTVLRKNSLIQSIAQASGFTLDIPTTNKLDKAVRHNSAPSASFENPIKEILYNDEKKVVIVLFKDGVKIVKKCHENDDFDLDVGVALAIAKHIYGNTTNYKKYLKRKAKKLNKEESEESNKEESEESNK